MFTTFGWLWSQSLMTSSQHLFVGVKDAAGAAEAVVAPAARTRAAALARATRRTLERWP